MCPELDKHFYINGGGGQKFYVGGGSGYDDVYVEEEMAVQKAKFLMSEVSKLSAGSTIFRCL